MTTLYIDDSGNQVQVAGLALVTGKQQLVLGNGQNDLILQTAGNVQIQVGNKFYPLTFNTDTTSTNKIASTTTILGLDSDLTTLVYPGDGNYVFVQQSKSFYIGSSSELVKLTSTDATSPLYLSYSVTQNLTGPQKLLLQINSGNIQSFSDITNYTTSSVYVNQLIYSITDKKHYVLTKEANPSARNSWSELYLALATGGVVNGPVGINIVAGGESFSALHIEGVSTITDARLNTSLSSIISLGNADYTAGLTVWTNDTTYFQNLTSNTTKGFKFLASTNAGLLTNPLTIYSSGVGIFGEPTTYALTMYGTSQFTELATLVKGSQSLNYSTGLLGQGYTLSIDPSDSKWLLEVDKLLVRDTLSQSSIFNSKSINGSYWSNPSIKIRTVQHLDEIDVYTLAEFSGNYKDVSGTKVLMTLSEKAEYALSDQSTDYTIPGSARTVSLMQIKFGIGDRDSGGTPVTEPTYVLDTTPAYVAITPTHRYTGSAFVPDSSGTYIINQTINIIYIETDSLSLLNVGDLLYYATWNPDGTEQRVITASVEVINSTGAILYVYNSESLDVNQELLIIASSVSNNGIHSNGIDPYGDYIEHLVNATTFRDLFYNFFYSTEETEQLPRNTYEPQTSVTTNKFGALNNLVDSDLALTAIPQIGIYSSNAYLKGAFVVNRGIYNNVPLVTTTTDKFLMLSSSNMMKQVDLTSKITNWDTAYSWGNHALAGYAFKTTTITATGSGLTGGGDLSANRTFSLDFTYLDSRYSGGGGGGGVGTYISLEVPAGSVNGSNTNFTLTTSPAVGSEMIFLNGLVQTASVDYTISGSVITFTTAPFTGDSIQVTYLGASSSLIGTYICLETPSGTINGSNVTFILANTPTSNTEMVILNGLTQERGVDYTMSTSTITFTIAPLTGDNLNVTYFKP